MNEQNDSFAGRESIYLPRPRPVSVEMRVERDQNVHWPVSNDSLVIVADTKAADLNVEGQEESQAQNEVEHHRPMSKSRARLEAVDRRRSYDFATEDSTIFDGTTDVLTTDMLLKVRLY